MSCLLLDAGGVLRDGSAGRRGGRWRLGASGRRRGDFPSGFSCPVQSKPSEGLIVRTLVTGRSGAAGFATTSGIKLWAVMACAKGETAMGAVLGRADVPGRSTEMAFPRLLAFEYCWVKFL